MSTLARCAWCLSEQPAEEMLERKATGLRLCVDCTSLVREFYTAIDMDREGDLVCLWCGDRRRAGAKTDEESANLGAGLDAKLAESRRHLAVCPEHPLSGLLKDAKAVAMLARTALDSGVSDFAMTKALESLDLAIAKAEGK